MYVKFMHSRDYTMHGENDFSIIEVHKCQRVCFWQAPGKGMEIQLIENDSVIEKYPMYGPAYVMNEQGKTIATYGSSLSSAKIATNSDNTNAILGSGSIGAGQLGK